MWWQFGYYSVAEVGMVAMAWLPQHGCCGILWWHGCCGVTWWHGGHSVVTAAWLLWHGHGCNVAVVGMVAMAWLL